MSGVSATDRARVLVIGGGLAGTAAAITLARAGCPVTLVERDGSPKHKVCGEFLSGEALALLDGLGVSARALGALPVRSVRLCSAKAVTESRLHFSAMSLTRLRLDAAMLARAEAEGVEVRRGIAVQALQEMPDGWTYRCNDGSDGKLGTQGNNGAARNARRVILASGKHDLRGFGRPRGTQGNLVALKMYWRLAPAQTAALAGSVELLLHPGGYTGLQCVEGGVANLSALIDRHRLGKLGGWEGFLALLRRCCPQARERLAGAVPLLEKPLAVAAIPYGFVRRQALGEGLWAVGDQAAVIPSFTGDGMSIALYSGVRAAESLLRGKTAEAYQRGLRRELRWQVACATALSLALVYAPSKAVVVRIARLFPGVLRGAARATRLPGMERLQLLSISAGMHLT